jgi:hypothetical protein
MTGKLQHVAAPEIREHQSGTRIEQEVAQRVEMQVAREIGYGQSSILIDPYEPRPSAAM